MPQKILLVFTALCSLSAFTFADDIAQMKIAIAKKKMTSVFNTIPMGTNRVKAFGMNKGDSLVVVVKPKENKDYYKVIIDDDLHGWVANKDIKVLKDSKVYTFDELTISYGAQENSFETIFGEKIPPTETLEMSISFKDKLSTNTDKEAIKRHSK